MTRMQGLSDTQKSDLQRIWATHCLNLLLHTDDICHPSMNLDNHSFQFIARLHSFFIHILTTITQQNNYYEVSSPHSALDTDKENTIPKASTVYDSLSHLFNFQQQDGTQLKPIILSKDKRYVVTFNCALFLQEFQSFENHRHQQLQKENESSSSSSSIPQIPQGDSTSSSLPNFGAFLYHKPQLAILVTNVSIALAVVTILRSNSSVVTSSPFTIAAASSSSSSIRNNNHPNNTSLSSSLYTDFIIVTQFRNVYPLLSLSDVKTSNTHKFITLSGRVIKVYPKRLRLWKQPVRCIKCDGRNDNHMVKDGITSVPDKCIGKDGMTCNGKQFEVLRRDAKYVDYQQLKIQEDESSLSSTGRTPRQIELELTEELVDTCQVGDVVQIVGVIHIQSTQQTPRSQFQTQQYPSKNYYSKKSNSASSNNEASTFNLYMVANSIVMASSLTSSSSSSKAHMDGSSNGGAGGTSNSSRGLSFSNEQLERITKLAHADHMFGPLSTRMAFPFDLLVRSLCPSIVGRDMVKAGIVLGLLGGTPSLKSGLDDVRSGVGIRSNSHILIVGDPGMGKSQMLLAANQVSTRSVYVGGNTSSTTGITVALTKEAGGETGLEAGALVLADQGVCCIDEFDKMQKSNQDGLLEAMEQQQISIAKAGVIASLPARCCIIAAANPKQGKYNMSKSVAENLTIATPLLSRFDLVFILKDEADLEEDRLVSSNIMNIYRQQSKTNFTESTIDTGRHGHTLTAKMKSDINSKKSIPMKQRLPWVAETQKALPENMLRDYISYAREYCKPKLTQEAATVLKDHFMNLRYPSDGSSRNDSVPITTRQLEALIRLSQARAKACLREFVLKEDAMDVVELMRESVNQVHMDSNGRLDRMRGGAAGKSKRKQKKDLMDTLRSLGSTKKFSKDDLHRVAAKLNLPLGEFWPMIDELRFGDQPELGKGPDGLYYISSW